MPNTRRSSTRTRCIALPAHRSQVTAGPVRSTDPHFRRSWVAAWAAVALIASAIGSTRTLRINFTSSLPRGIYRTVTGPPSRGAMVLLCLPPAVARFARTRRYVWRGDCPGEAAPVGKVVSAVAGDTVVATVEGLNINGRSLPNTAARSRDGKGRPMTRIPSGRYVVAPGQLWLTSTYNPASFDSRYFGPVLATAVITQIEPLWTFPAKR